AGPPRSAGSAARSCASSGNAMSRIGKRPIEIPAGVTVSVDPGRVAVAGPLGTLQQRVPARMQVAQDEGTGVVTRPTERGEDRPPEPYKGKGIRYEGEYVRRKVGKRA